MITDVWPMIRKDLTELPPNISNPYWFKTVLHQRTWQRKRYTHKSDMLLPPPSNIVSFVRWKISLFNDASSYLLINSNKSTHYYIVPSHQGCIHSCLKCHREILYWLHKTTLKGIPHNLYRCALTLPPPPKKNYINFLLISPGANTTMECVPK